MEQTVFRLFRESNGKSTALEDDESGLFTKTAIEKMYYIDAVMNNEANHHK